MQKAIVNLLPNKYVARLIFTEHIRVEEVNTFLLLIKPMKVKINSEYFLINNNGLIYFIVTIAFVCITIFYICGCFMYYNVIIVLCICV